MISEPLAVQGANGVAAPEHTVELLAEAWRYLAKWQPRLRLDSWQIWLTYGEVSEPDWAAMTTVEWRERRAQITLPSDCIARSRNRGLQPPGITDGLILEQTIIHELLHVVEQPLASRLITEIGWIAGDKDGAGVLGAELRNAWRDYREWWINHQGRTLLEAERSHGWRE